MPLQTLRLPMHIRGADQAHRPLVPPVAAPPAAARPASIPAVVAPLRVVPPPAQPASTPTLAEAPRRAGAGR